MRSYCTEILVALGLTLRIRPPPPKDLNIKNSYHIALFDMYINMGERIAGKQYRPSLIITGTPRDPQIAKNAKENHILAHI